MRRATLRCAFALGALLVAPAASAQHNSPTAVLRYERGEGASACPDAQAVRDAVAARLGYDPFRESAPMTVRATITRHRRRLRGRVEVTDAAGAAVGTREIESSRRDCAEIASALTLAVSIVIDPLSLTRPAPAPAPPAPAPAPAPAPPPPPPPQPVVAAPAPPPPAPPPAPPRPPRSPSRRPALEVTLGGGLAFGHTPGLTGAVTASVGLRWSVVSLAIEGDHAFLSTAAREDGGAGEVQGSLSTGRLVPCLRQRLGARVDGAACGVVALGALGATAVGVDVSRPDTAFYAAVGLRLAARVALSPLLGLRVRADLLGALTPISLVIRDGTQELVVWSASPAALTAGIDLTATFP